ncbi:prolyl oligopeptidase family serine peptidase [Phenylobacterium sp.]|uniref:alpha/beta hydrolase family protein n=1 Tax=Phenylobacterium sp. TaxID=1871053 RepID=UPI0025F76897|nr:prolyl oligopeptidase family serine peptidase [Phenylobacterium sp.]
MRAVRNALAGLATALLSLTGAAAAPLEAYSRLPAIQVVTVSPSGDQLAIVVTDGQQVTLTIQDVATRAFKAKVVFGEIPVQAVRWAGEGHVLITTAVQFNPPNATGGLWDWRRVHDLDIATQKLRPLLGDTETDLNNVQGAPIVRTVDGRTVVLLSGLQWVDHRGYVALYEVDLETGHSKVAEPAVEGSRRWLVDADGRAIAREMYDDKARTWSLEIRDGKAWRAILTASKASEAATIAGLGADGRAVDYTVREGDRRVLKQVRVDGGTAAPDIVLPGSHRLLTDPQTGRVLGHYGWDGDAFVQTYLDPADDAAMKKVSEAYPAIEASVGSWSDDRRKLVAWVDAPGSSPGFAYIDLDQHHGHWIGREYPGLSEADVGAQSRIRFKAADGLDLSGYLTRPPGRAQARNLPLIVVPHDLPSERDLPGFNWFVQALASRGYAVLQVNTRGTAGLGAELRKAGEGQLGRGMQSDLADGVGALASSGLIDPSRVCIVGQGYGGYAAMGGATFDNQPYRCAASIDGGFELRWPKTGVKRGSEAEQTLKQQLGVDGPDDPRLARYSPLKQAAKAHIPVLLVHGKNDVRYPFDNSKAMAEALKKAGKPFEFVALEDGDWRFSRADARRDMLNAVVGFLEKHNPPN